MTDIDILCSTSVGTRSSRSPANQQFTTSSIEQMLRRKDSGKEFIVIENNRKKSSSTTRSTFGFPVRLTEDNAYERLHGYTSCFHCKITYTFQSDGSGSTKHLLKHVCPKIPSTSEHHHDGPLAKLLK